MAKSPDQILANHVQHAERSRLGLAAAKAAGNSQLATLNIQQGFKACLMRGLLEWRTGMASPVSSLKEAVQRVDDGVGVLQALNALHVSDLPLEKAAIVSYLIDASLPAGTATELIADRLLDVALGDGLRGLWNESTWNTGLEQLRDIKNAALAVETYSTYRKLLHADKTESTGLVETATKLFEKRAKDEFFSGGDLTEGGGPYNAITVDYRLAAVMKKLSYTGENLHRWQWS